VQREPGPQDVREASDAFASPRLFLHRPLPIGFVGSDDPDLASYLRIEERELEAGGVN
jgi:hypothetical protein